MSELSQSIVLTRAQEETLVAVDVFFEVNGRLDLNETGSVSDALELRHSDEEIRQALAKLYSLGHISGITVPEEACPVVLYGVTPIGREQILAAHQCR